MFGGWLIPIFFSMLKFLKPTKLPNYYETYSFLQKLLLETYH